MAEDRLQKLQRVRPEALNIVLLDEISAKLELILERLARVENEMQRVPEGILEPMEVNVSDKITTLTSAKPWCKFTIVNDGEHPVYVMVNRVTAARTAPLNPGDSLTVDWASPKIHTIYLVCDKGKTTSCRIYASK